MGILKWNADNCLVDDKLTSKCYFDYWSIMHCFTVSILYIIFLLYIHNKTNNKIKFALYGLIFINILHIIEDIQENIFIISLENIFKCKFDKPADNDSFQNFIGDIVSGLIGTVIIYIYYIL